MNDVPPRDPAQPGEDAEKRVEAMQWRPILFSAPMVRALLEGRKTQTRRLLKPPRGFVPDDDPDHWDVGFWNQKEVQFVCWPEDDAVMTRRAMPYAVGDRLWVREILRQDGQGFPIYGADGASLLVRDSLTGEHMLAPDWWYWKPLCPSIHMPRWASRLTLVVTDVRVQYLQDISEEDAEAEGCGGYGHDFDCNMGAPITAPFHPDNTCSCKGDSYPEVFRRLWESIHGPGSWDANPWVAAISFSVHKVNIDRMAQDGQ
jgi:hypothetical protein